ncbi:MAG: hypothetical protein EOO23_06015 [Comamonadaceae bacterium]|nr:MAG: hypothetical protein EOO23_06015 [Comamonadaceae bacterium]
MMTDRDSTIASPPKSVCHHASSNSLTNGLGQAVADANRIHRLRHSPAARAIRLEDLLIGFAAQLRCEARDWEFDFTRASWVWYQQ